MLPHSFCSRPVFRLMLFCWFSLPLPCKWWLNLAKYAVELLGYDESAEIGLVCLELPGRPRLFCRPGACRGLSSRSPVGEDGAIHLLQHYHVRPLFKRMHKNHLDSILGRTTLYHEAGLLRTSRQLTNRGNVLPWEQRFNQRIASGSL